MGVNRFRRTRTERSFKFSNAQVTSAKREAETLLDLVDEDVVGDHNLYCPCCEEEEATASISLVEDLIGVDDQVCTRSFIERLGKKSRTNYYDQVLYEMGILYDSPTVDLPGIEIDPDWDMVSVVSELEWDVVSLDGFSDDDEPLG